MIITYHSIIHKSVLSAKLSQSFRDTRINVMKLINYLRSKSSLQHQQLKAYLEEMSAEHAD